MNRFITSGLIVCLSVVALTSCQDYEGGFSESKIKEAAYAKKFVKAFGEIDPNQDFNLATRATVNVSVSGSSNIKIYASNGTKYQIVGDYTGVTGSQELGVDVVKGTTDLIVTDGQTSIMTEVGGSASFGSTRAIHLTTDPNSFVKVSKIPAEGITIGKTLYPQFKTIEEQEYTNLKDFIPEIDQKEGVYRKYTNLNKVTHDFLYVSTGKFIIYPFYWVTNASDKLGIYYKDGSDIVEVPVYDIKGDEITYLNSGQGRVSFTDGNCNNLFAWGTDAKSQGIVVDIPSGTVFGMYLINSDHKFYSQSSLNSAEGYAVIDNGTGTLTTSTTEYASYASTFELNGQMFLGFEDWSNVYNSSDMDLNDVVFAFSGATPTIIDEDPTSASWVLACEDLGGTFDTDYNDVVFSVEHVSGRTTATITPLAAGGTLASHIVYNSQDLGEIHQLLGASETTTGSYTPINVGSSRGNAGMQKTIIVDKDFSMSTSEVGTITGSGNMGGFQVLTYYDANSTPSVIAAPNRGKVPEMICLPYTYDVENDPEDGKKTTYTWAWPQELKTIYNTQSGAYGAGAYPEFGAWVNDYTSNTDWYKHPTKSLTVAEKKVESSMTSGGGGSTGGGSQGSSASPLTVNKSAYNTWNYGECSYLVSGDVSLLKNGAVLTFGLKDSYTSINIDLGTSYGGKDIKQGINSNTYSIEDATKFTIDGDSFSFYLTTWNGGDDTVTGVTIK